MKLTPHIFESLADDPEIRVNAFRALQSIEQRLPIRVVRASIASYTEADNTAPSLVTKRPILLMVAKARPRSVVAALEIQETLRDTEFAIRYRSTDSIVTLVESDDVFCEAWAADCVSEMPLVISPYGPHAFIQSHWGLPLHSSVKQAFGFMQLRSTSNIAFISIQRKRSSYLDDANRSRMACSIRKVATTLHNGKEALTADQWEKWTFPSGIQPSIEMLRNVGIRLTSEDEETLLRCSSNDFVFWAQRVKLSEAVAVSRKSVRLFTTIRNQIIDHVTCLLSQHDMSIDPGSEYVLDCQKRFESMHDNDLSMFDATLVSDASVNLYDRRTYRYRRIDPPIPAEQRIIDADAQPMFSF